MALVVADTSALVSLGTVATHGTRPLDVLLDEHRVAVPERVVSELRETATYEDRSGDAARAVLDRLPEFDVRAAELDEEFPLDDGENAAVALANDLDATQLVCDEFNQLALVHASLADSRLVTTPVLLTAFVRNRVFAPADAKELLSAISDTRSWDSNTYVARARSTLRGESE